jgi:hypothetical protein
MKNPDALRIFFQEFFGGKFKPRKNIKYENLATYLLSYSVSVGKLWTQNSRIIHDVWRLLILSNDEKRMIMNILKKEWFIWKYDNPGFLRMDYLQWKIQMHSEYFSRNFLAENLNRGKT